MSEEDGLLQEIRKDIRIIATDMSSLRTKLEDINLALEKVKGSMPSVEKFQELELKMAKLETQFKIVWVACGVLGVITLGAMMETLMRLM